MKATIAALLLAVLATAPLTIAGIAQADTQDDQFLAALSAQGTPGQIGAGHAACANYGGPALVGCTDGRPHGAGAHQHPGTKRDPRCDQGVLPREGRRAATALKPRHAPLCAPRITYHGRGVAWLAVFTFSQVVGDDRQAAGNAGEDDHLPPFSALRSHPVDLRHVIGPGILVRAHRCPSHPSILRSGPTVLGTDHERLVTVAGGRKFC